MDTQMTKLLIAQLASSPVRRKASMAYRSADTPMGPNHPKKNASGAPCRERSHGRTTMITGKRRSSRMAATKANPRHPSPSHYSSGTTKPSKAKIGIEKN